MLINLIAWGKNNFTNKVMDMLSDESKRDNLTYVDQDLLNILFLGNTISLDRKYNCIYSEAASLTKKTLDRHQEIITDDIILIHYTGTIEPWLTWENHPAFKNFAAAVEASPWSPEDIYTKTAIHYKAKYRYEILQKNIPIACCLISGI